MFPLICVKMLTAFFTSEEVLRSYFGNFMRRSLELVRDQCVDPEFGHSIASLDHICFQDEGVGKRSW